MIHENNAPERFWAETINTACYIVNRVYVRKGSTTNVKCQDNLVVLLKCQMKPLKVSKILKNNSSHSAEPISLRV